MQTMSPEPESYFEYPARRTPASIDSTPISPFTSQESRHTPNKPSKRPSYHVRSESDYTVVRSRLMPRLVAEIPYTQNPNTPNLIISRPDSVIPFADSLITPVSIENSVQAHSPAILLSDFRKDVNDYQTISNSVYRSESDFPPRRPRLGYQWEHNTSEGVWYERPKSSRPHLKQSFSSSRLWSFGSSNQPLPNVMTPLPPPRPRQSISSPPYEHPRIKIEKSFTQVSLEYEGVSDKPSANVSPGSRRGSISPRQIFSAPSLIAKKFHSSRQKRKVIASENTGKALQSIHLELPDHQTQLKRRNTLEALRRVTTILHDLHISRLSETPASPKIVPLRHKTVTSKSSDSKDSKDPAVGHMKMVRGILSPPIVNIAKSLDNSTAISYTSSQRNLMMGSQPNNTPDEKATYKIKRSPSAESELFFKVDISIWGGTSYLPSEARRIHTPPLPEDGINGKKRGFFFDYNDPGLDLSGAGVKVDEQPPFSDSPETCLPVKQTLTQVVNAGKRLSPMTATKRNCNEKQKGDWYDAKLAELDSLPVDETAHGGKTGLYAIEEVKSTQKKTYNLIQDVPGGTWQKLQQKPQFDLTIPEHLPNSPLCPRHPRYWRLVKDRGSQFRGCWMHGVGVYER